ncbi:EsaB/YukD family protein [Isobaculum melis]|uniref:Uncharacterized ubiquitin-like protein YukD n=1 Tax=Isobaculum melis TaxID=142588 RepID=A0A1H9QEW9_9LACT|nr:EsaB/YukD family protein [Isobaculum melis]SER58343.1 Uncharacterized ubiquitin-like protein YukD [Isobaculum melis]
MSAENHINITLYYRENPAQQYDLRVPIHQTVKYFIDEMDNTLHVTRKSQAKGIYQLKVLNKGLVLTDNQKMNDYPITTGDQIEIY